MTDMMNLNIYILLIISANFLPWSSISACRNWMLYCSKWISIKSIYILTNCVYQLNSRIDLLSNLIAVQVYRRSSGQQASNKLCVPALLVLAFLSRILISFICLCLQIVATMVDKVVKNHSRNFINQVCQMLYFPLSKTDKAVVVFAKDFSLKLVCYLILLQYPIHFQFTLVNLRALGVIITGGKMCVLVGGRVTILLCWIGKKKPTNQPNTTKKPPIFFQNIPK